MQTNLKSQVGAIIAILTAISGIVGGLLCALNHFQTGGMSEVISNYSSCYLYLAPTIAILSPGLKTLAQHASGGVVTGHGPTEEKK